MERKITVGYWYIVGGPAGATVTVKGEVNPCCTVPEGGQGSFFAQAPVVIVSDEAITLSQVVNFKCAPVKRWLLGLGRGVQTLPAGYLAADFLFINTRLSGVPIFTVSPDTSEANLEVVLNMQPDLLEGTNFVTSDSKQFGIALYAPYNTKIRWQYGGSFEYGGAIEFDKKYKINKVGRFNYVNGELVYTNVQTSITATETVKLAPWHNPCFYLYRLKCDNTKNERHEYIPAITDAGSPCLFDKITKKTYILNLTVGFTLAQARQLSKLPAEGGNLTVSLPWEAQLVITGVPAALQVAADKGWTITVQYREPEADNEYYNKYAECVTVADMQAVNADYKNDLTKDGEWIYPLPELINSSGAFARSDDFVSFDADLPELTYGVSMFRNMPKMEKFKGSLKALINGQEMFCYSYSFTDFDSTLESLTEGLYMFMGCQLNKESALNVLYSVPSYTDRKHNLHLGIHIDHQTDEEVLAAIADAETKGWNVGVQWNGTATAQTASTFGLRRPTIYAKLGTVARPDGTTENVLDWGHYVTDWEANGYMEFASVEEAKEYFNIGD